MELLFQRFTTQESKQKLNPPRETRFLTSTLNSFYWLNYSVIYILLQIYLWYHDGVKRYRLRWWRFEFFFELEFPINLHWNSLLDFNGKSLAWQTALHTIFLTHKPRIKWKTECKRSIGFDFFLSTEVISITQIIWGSEFEPRPFVWESCGLTVHYPFAVRVN